jgi:Type II intron maturase
LPTRQRRDRPPCPPRGDQGQISPYLHRGKPSKQKALTNGSDHTIVATYGAIYRGIVQYYLLAGDVYRLHRLRWVMETSMLKTLAGKHHSTVSKMAAKHKTKTGCSTAASRSGRSPRSSGCSGRRSTAPWSPRSPSRSGRLTSADYLDKSAYAARMGKAAEYLV